MEFYFTDRKFNLLGMASTDLPNAIRITRDLEESDTEEGVSIFTGTLVMSNAKLGVIKTMAKRGNYIIFKNEDKEDKYYTIIRTERNRQKKELYFYAEDAGLDLLNETVGPYEADKAYPASFYIDKFTFDSGFEIGINEIRTLNRKLKWEGEATATKRVLSVATQFDNAEIRYRFEINNQSMMVTKKYIDIFRKRGADLDVELRLGHEIDNIITTESIENLATAIQPTGATPEGKEVPTTLKGFIRDDGGRFYSSGDGIVRDRESIKFWSRYITAEADTNQGHIVRLFSWETTNQSELYNRSVERLKILSEPEVNFEVDINKLPDNIRLGDRINIADEGDELYLNTRILKLKLSRSDNIHVATLGDFIIKESDIHADLRELADKIATIQKGDTWYPWVRYADDDKGKNMSPTPANKKYMATKYVVNNPIPSDNVKDYEGLWTLIQGESIQGPPGEDGKPTYTWIRYADTVSGAGISASPTGKKYIGLAYNKDTANATSNPVDYQWFLAKGKDGEDGKNGADGKTTYFYAAWADSIDGKSGFTINSSQSANKGYLGTYSSTSATQSTTPTSYSWIKLAGAFEEQIKQLEANITAVPKVLAQPTAPRFPEPNMQWWKTESAVSNDIIGYFKWDGSKWQEQTIQQSLLNIVELNAVEINGSVISGSSFLNYWSKPQSGREGIMRIEHGILSSDYTVANGNIGSMLLDENQLRFDMKDSTGKVMYGMRVSPQTIAISDASQSYGTVELRYADLMAIQPTALTASTGFSRYDTSGVNLPTASRSMGRSIQLSGAFKNNSQLTANSSGIMGILPVWARPKEQVNFRMQGSGINTFMLVIRTNGELELSRYGASGYVDIPAGSWLNISCGFTAAN